MYTTGKVMPLIGRQTLDEMWTEEALQGLQEICNSFIKAARKQIPKAPVDSLIDSYIWGYINGKRAERSRRKRTSSTGNTDSTDPRQITQQLIMRHLHRLDEQQSLLTLRFVQSISGEAPKVDGNQQK